MFAPENKNNDRSGLPASVVGAAAAGLLAAWIAAGSIGVLAEPLRVVFTWLTLGLAAVLVQPKSLFRKRSSGRDISDRDAPSVPVAWLGVLCVAVMLGLPVFTRTEPVHEVLVVAAILATLADGRSGAPRKVFLLCSFAALTLGLYRIACLSVPVIWLFANSFGAAMGHLAGFVTGRPLSVGATFAGVDFLVLMTAFYCGWLTKTEGPRVTRGLFAAISIVVGHFFYLLVLAFATDISAWFPTLPPPPFQHPYVPPNWNWADAIRQLLPWNLPVLAAVIQITIVCFMLRWTAPSPHPSPADGGGGLGIGARNSSADGEGGLGSGSRNSSADGGRGSVGHRMAILVPLALAAAFAVSTTLSWGVEGLSDKVIVANQHGHLDWIKPQHDQYGQQAAGQFGMLPALVESLGARLKISSDVTDNLTDCDVLLLLHPTAPMPDEKRTRLWSFVRGGGALLIVAQPNFQQGNEESNFNHLLAPTAIHVRQDVAISEAGNWQHACLTVANPATANVNPRNGYPFSDVGASLDIKWPARPLVIGRWGWSDPGSDAVLSGIDRLEAGETLGDIVLAAEQPFGRGTVVVLGDSFSLTNEGLVHGYDWVGRLLSYLASRRGSPTATWRQAITLLLGLALLTVLWRHCNAGCLVGVAFVLAVSLAVCGISGRSMTRLVPNGRLIDSENRGVVENADSELQDRNSSLAYIDASHIGAYSDRDWAFDGINGLALNLMRDGFLTLALPKIERDRLAQAAVIVSIAPARQFSQHERRLLKAFVENGGVLICSIGAEEARPSQLLLADFGLRVPQSPVPTDGQWEEPEPMGRFRSLYLDAQEYGAGDYKVGVAFHAGWPVDAVEEDSEVLVHGEHDAPIVVCRHIGQGKVVLIGDTGFAMNKNLEYIGGEPFEGRYENAHFWRWLIARVIRDEDWIPPPPEPLTDNAETQEGQE